MQGTSHTKMRTASRVNAEGCIVRKGRPARGVDERRHVAESVGWRR